LLPLMLAASSRDDIDSVDLPAPSAQSRRRFCLRTIKGRFRRPCSPSNFLKSQLDAEQRRAAGELLQGSQPSRAFSSIGTPASGCGGSLGPPSISHDAFQSIQREPGNKMINRAVLRHKSDFQFAKVRKNWGQGRQKTLPLGSATSVPSPPPGQG